MNDLAELREKMKFHGYATRNLDEIESAFFVRYGRKPKAYMARSPFGIHGKHSNLKMLVLSSKHCGANAVFVPLIMDMGELQETIFALGETHQKVYVDRRKAEKEQALTDALEANRRRTYSRHCTYCGVRYTTDVVNPVVHCGSFGCKKEHNQHLKIQREMNRQSRARAVAATTSKKSPTVNMPDFELDNPYHSTLQGYVYCIRAENGLCKIGRSDDVSSRFSEIKSASPIAVYIEHTVFSDNYVLAEKYAHSVCNEYRHHGEWFDLPENVLDWFISLDNYDLDDSPEPPGFVQ